MGLVSLNLCKGDCAEPVHLKHQRYRSGETQGVHSICQCSHLHQGNDSQVKLYEPALLSRVEYDKSEKRAAHNINTSYKQEEVHPSCKLTQWPREPDPEHQCSHYGCDQ